MLDATTKRNIDAARNVLVGKVPDPKAQVEQITTALIYKFMDDLDKESIELGGKAKYFTGDYEKYSWTKVVDTRLTGEGRLDLYVQAITNMSRNPNLPQLFRDIFKGAFLPYNDPQTLSLFLKEINKFTYDHSEELGNAFEYLLSVLGSQGDAGQFRTPRHIIDFIVEVVDPKKTDTILDPACGTAGFLISAYKHIRKHNSSNFAPEEGEKSVIGDTAAEMILTERKVYTGDKLTPSERKKLTQNIQGYDISPDMVRLSLVNMYLHGFSGPKIFEYDTLSSEKKWGDTFDVMLANPPFMTPKGGIRPHKRFQVKAKRSEVLFVDYILEHLNINGRAGIIVPEGIIFKSETAYKKLRKLLIEDGLIAVVSLPSGVFNPYSGVKTSILLFDNQIAKKTDEIIFIKVENDGFGLGAQRRKINKNDLPEALIVLKDWMIGKKRESKLALWVKKDRICEDGENNLTGDRYRKTEENFNKEWPMVELHEVLDYEQPTKYLVTSVDYDDSYHTPVLTAGKTFILGYTNEEDGICDDSLPVIIFDDFTTASRYIDFPFKVKSSAMKILRAKSDSADIKFIFHMMQKIKFDASTHKRYWISKYSRIKIPLPPMKVQQEIIAQIGEYQRIIDGAKQVVENYQPIIRTDPNWPMFALGEAIEFVSGLTLSIPKNEADDGISIISINDVSVDGFISKESIRKIRIPKGKKINYCQKGDLLFNWRNGSKRLVGKTGYFDFDGKYVFASFLLGIRPKHDFFLSKYLWHVLNNYRKNGQYRQLMRESVNGLFNREELKILKVQIPPIETQQNIIDEFEEEQKIIDANKKLIRLMEEKIEKVLEEI